MRLALWLMDRFGVTESLAGDLVEERSRKRSALWLWRQAVVVAIARAMAGDVRAHKWLAARAVITGWVLGQFVVAPIRRIVIPLMSSDWVWTSERWLDRALGFPTVPLPYLIVMGVSALVMGWIVARLHPGHEMSMVFVYVVALLLFETGGFLNSLVRGLQAFGVYGLAFNSLFPFVVTPALVVIGGLLTAPGERRHRLA